MLAADASGVSEESVAAWELANLINREFKRNLAAIIVIECPYSNRIFRAVANHDLLGLRELVEEFFDAGLIEAVAANETDERFAINLITQLGFDLQIIARVLVLAFGVARGPVQSGCNRCRPAASLPDAINASKEPKDRKNNYVYDKAAHEEPA